MALFTAGDAIYILPKYAHLYSGNRAKVIRVIPDPYRSMFNGYVVEFPDGSKAGLMEYQIIEDMPNYNTDIARLIVASQHQTTQAHIRGYTPGSQIVLQTPEYDIDMTISVNQSDTSLIGQVLERSTTNLLQDIDVRLMKESTLLSMTRSDRQGVFKFHNVPSGPLNVLVVIPQCTTRILGALSI